MIYLGIDWGEKRIGLALGSDDVNIATPYKIVTSIDDIKEIIEVEDIKHIVIGKPVKMSGSSDDMTPDFLKFLDDFKKVINIPFDLIDERLTSIAADSLTLGRDRAKLTKKKRKTSAERDSVAAMLILQSYFDMQS
jgi:putative Holliday junction resolvase